MSYQNHHGALTNRLTELVKASEGESVPDILLRAIIDAALDELPAAFARDGEDTRVDWRKLTLEALIDGDEWVECADGTLWPESLCENVGGEEDGTIWMPKAEVEA
jgi:hypothetical protein